MAGTNQEQRPESLESTLATVKHLALKVVNLEEAAEMMGLNSLEEEQALVELNQNYQQAQQALLEACKGDEDIARLATLAATYNRDLVEALTKAYSL